MIMRMFGVTTPTNQDFVYKGLTGAEILLPTEVGKHMPYDPKLLPVVMLHTFTSDERVFICDNTGTTVVNWERDEYYDHSFDCRCEVCRFWS